MAGRFAPRPARTPSAPYPPRFERPARTPGATVPGPARPGAAPAPAEGLRGRWTPPEGPYDLGLTLGPLRRGPGDPTFRVEPGGAVRRASRTPEGPGALRLVVRGGAVEAEAWGPGAPWLLARLPALLGAEDDPGAFVPRHRLLADTLRRRPGLRLCRTGLILESLIPSVLEQKVTTVEAYRAWRRLVRRHGEPAPGPPLPSGEPLYVMPDARTWALIPSWEWHRAGVDAKRSSTVLRAVRAARRVEEAAAMAPDAARARLELIPGIGPWTSAEVVQRTNGAPDEVTVGDLHLPGVVGHALAGDRNADDAAMLDLLAPYPGQRHRATRLILLSGRTPPRRAPRMPAVDIARL
ncbi:DNA-3-methyladenine glycosylase 2 family protein [Streptomyces sp. NPDC093085]|uniref:DNA-3-methyladenine glycosylase family protein n=1 Tax=Streptomyces sp. NPDC093085 TaxID=3155068 RepID=UPI00342010CA